MGPGDKVVQNANNKIASELDKTLNGSETETETPPITDGRAIVEARDEAAKSRNPNVAKHLTDAQKAELGGQDLDLRLAGNLRMRRKHEIARQVKKQIRESKQVEGLFKKSTPLRGFYRYVSGYEIQRNLMRQQNLFRR